MSQLSCSPPAFGKVRVKTARAQKRKLLAVAGIVLLLASAGLAQSGACTQAAQSFQAHRWAEAAAGFQQCENASPGNTDALLFRGKALVNVDDFSGATAALETYIASHPASDDALYLLGYVRFRQDHPKESLETFARAAKLKPPEADDLKIAALDYVLLNDYDNAARYLGQSLKMNPLDAEARYHLGRVRYQQNHFDEAIAAFEGVLRQDPNNVRAEDNLGLCLEAKNHNADAIAAYQKAVQWEAASPVRNAQPYIDLGKLLNTLNRSAEAVPLLSNAVKIQPQSPAARYELGRALFLLKRFDEAKPELEEAVKLDPENSSHHYLLGRVYARLGESERASAQFKMTEELMRRRSAKSGAMASRR
jgi:tetratricopeptide (TPR) repeat protein